MRINKNNYEAFFLDYFEGTLSAERVGELMLFLEQHPDLKTEFDAFENISLNDLEDGIKFEGKEQLKKATITSSNFDEIAVLLIEGKLSDEEENTFFKFIGTQPEFKVQFDLYRKTILPADVIIFENKVSLKKQAESITEKVIVMLSAVEGTITSAQQRQLDSILASDKEMENELIALRKTKLVVDASIVFPDKNSLKRSVSRVIPFYYYIAAAASAALLIGFYFLSGNEQLKGDQFSCSKRNSILNLHIAPQNTLPTPNKIANSKEKNRKNNSIIPNDNENNKKKNEIPNNNERQDPILVKNENKIPDTLSTKEVIVKNEHPLNDTEQNILVNSFNDQDDSPLKNNNNDYLSLGQTLAFKMKNKMLKEEMSDASTYKEDRKRITWYDAVLLAMKGVRNLTGREVDVKKKYNDNDELIAYQITAGNRTFTKAVTKKPF